MIKVYNTLTKKKELLKPIKNKEIKIFVCGPTVYDFSHLGHARTYVSFDTIVKFLRWKGYKVFYLQNITDIDDKIISRAKKEKASWKKIAKKFEKEYLKDMKLLEIDSVSKYARATEHIEEIISQIKRLLKKGFAYEIEEGIYYDISKFKNYGKLSRRTILQAEDAVSRIDESEKKKNKGDFCLWKRSKPEEPRWSSPWFLGRPGWHIEDTAITEKYFGPQYDIHGGAVDLIFPHHEAEICQMESISGKSPMVRYWIHTGLLTVNQKKMSKSLGNFITIRDFLKKSSARILRYLILRNHYRSRFDYSEKLIDQAKKELKKLDEIIREINEKIKKKKILQNKGKNLNLKKFKKEIIRAMEDDFNTPKTIGKIFNLTKGIKNLVSKNQLRKKDALEFLLILKEIDQFFNFIFAKEKKEKIPKTILKLANEREKYRKMKNFQMADKLREKIKKMGFWIEDTEEGFRIKKLNNQF